MVNPEMINDLWLQIDTLHLSYLHTEESPQRIEQKKKLKGKHINIWLIFEFNLEQNQSCEIFFMFRIHERVSIFSHMQSKILLTNNKGYPLLITPETW